MRPFDSSLTGAGQGQDAIARSERDSPEWASRRRAGGGSPWDAAAAQKGRGGARGPAGGPAEPPPTGVANRQRARAPAPAIGYPRVRWNGPAVSGEPDRTSSTPRARSTRWS